MYNIVIMNDIGSYFIVIQTRFMQMLLIVGFFKGGFCCLQEVTFFRSWCLISLSIVRVDFIGPPGLSCLVDVKTL